MESYPERHTEMKEEEETDGRRLGDGGGIFEDFRVVPLQCEWEAVLDMPTDQAACQQTCMYLSAMSRIASHLVSAGFGVIWSKQIEYFDNAGFELLASNNLAKGRACCYSSRPS